MKVTVLFENTQEKDGEDTLITFSKDDIVFVEDLLNAMGRAAVAGGFTYLDTLEAHGKDTSWRAHF